MLLGADRRSAAEFSFYLAMPTMVGAFAFDLYKSGAHLSGSNIIVIAVGFVMSFIAGWFVVKSFLDYVSGHGFTLFAWWRLIVGTLGLIGLLIWR
jgi:undecaprenyl-diphosphatase